MEDYVTAKYIDVTNGILRVPTTVLYARSVVKYAVRTTFHRAGRRQAFSPRSGYFQIPLRNLAPFDSVCFPFLFNTLNSSFTPFRYFSIRLYLQYHVPYKLVSYSRIQLVRISTRFPPLLLLRTASTLSDKYGTRVVVQGTALRLSR